MVIYSQQDPLVANTLLGFSDMTISQGGCLITALGTLLNLDPNTTNERLKGVNGFAAPQNSDQRNLLIWAKVAEAFPPVTATRVWSYNEEDVMAHTGSVLVEVSGEPIGGGKNGKHWIILKDADTCIDPFTGTERPYSDFPVRYGYAIINGIEAPIEVPSTPEENSNVYKGLDLTDPDSVRAAIDAWYDVANGLYIRADEHMASIQSIASTAEATPDVDAINAKINELKTRPVEVQTVEVVKEVPANPDTLIDAEKAGRFPQLVNLWRELTDTLKVTQEG